MATNLNLKLWTSNVVRKSMHFCVAFDSNIKPCCFLYLSSSIKHLPCILQFKRIIPFIIPQIFFKFVRSLYISLPNVLITLRNSYLKQVKAFENPSTIHIQLCIVALDCHLLALPQIPKLNAHFCKSNLPQKKLYPNLKEEYALDVLFFVP
jgi:hypothetical protein